MYQVVSIGDGGWVLDTATTADMGVQWDTAAGQHRTAVAYAETMVAQYARQSIPASVRVYGPYGDVVWACAEECFGHEHGDGGE